MNKNVFANFRSIQEYEDFQKSRILSVILAITGIMTIPMAISNLNQQAYTAAISLFTFSLICLLGLVLNQKKYYRSASVLFIMAGYAVVFFNLADGGGLRDTSIVALPILTIFAGLLFGKIATLVCTGITILLVLGFHALNLRGAISPDFTVGNSSLIIMNLILVIVGASQYVFMVFWERNFQWVQHSEEQIREAYEQTLEGWAKALEFRDRETEGHSRRVVDLSLKLARKLHIHDEEALNQIRQGALLHDIGKMAIPDSILLKPGPLDDEEWEEIKKHPLLAKKLLEDTPFLSSILEIPLHHHERWNGSGYPLGLKAEEIPLQARIFMVIDNWDALCSDRPYRQAWEQEKVIRYLKDNAGILFDPLVVDHFIELIREENRL